MPCIGFSSFLNSRFPLINLYLLLFHIGCYRYSVLAYWVKNVAPGLVRLGIGVLLLLLLVGLIFRWRWSVITAAVLSSSFFSGSGEPDPLAVVESPWHRQFASKAVSADAIVVLSGSRHPTPDVSRFSVLHDIDRFLAGLDHSLGGQSTLLAVYLRFQSVQAQPVSRRSASF